MEGSTGKDGVTFDATRARELADAPIPHPSTEAFDHLAITMSNMLRAAVAEVERLTEDRDAGSWKENIRLAAENEKLRAAVDEVGKWERIAKVQDEKAHRWLERMRPLEAECARLADANEHAVLALKDALAEIDLMRMERDREFTELRLAMAVVAAGRTVLTIVDHHPWPSITQRHIETMREAFAAYDAHVAKEDDK